jgi:hypothetical protein
VVVESLLLIKKVRHGTKNENDGSKEIYTINHEKYKQVPKKPRSRTGTTV